MIGLWVIIIGMATFGLVAQDNAAVFASLIMAGVAVISSKIG
jgi:hypothetical protein